MPRLLRCSDCLTLEELPDFLGSVEDEANDPLLKHLVSRHQGPLNREQLRTRPANAPRVREIREDEGHIGVLMKVAPDDWIDANRRAGIIKQIWADHTGFEEEFYATKATFQEDALACFSRHSRPKEGCIDWREDSKRLTPAQWHKQHVYLCDFCPVAVWVTTQLRKRRGDYNE